MRGRAFALTLLFATASIGPAAVAQTETKSRTSAIDRARAQFQQGLALETAGDWAGALAIFQQVALVRLTPQVRFHIGLCEEHLGQLAAALGDYELAAHEADEAKVAEVSAQVASRRDDLRARIPQITITRGVGGEYASVSLDGVSLGAASIGVKLPVDPGPHRVEALASGFKPFRATIDVSEKEAKKVEITLERIPLPSQKPEPATPSPVGPDTGDTAPPRTNLVPFVVGGAGVVSLGAGVVFLLLRQNAINTLDAECTLPPGQGCPAGAQSTYDQGRTYNLLANVTLGVGVAAIGTGTVLFLTQNKPKSTTPMAVAPGAAGAPLGATFAGSF